jgi:hypothetical protein
MRKVVCSKCGLVNLERFVTFPHCAGCGTRLPEGGAPPARGIWAQPLRAPFWASIVALGCAALAVAVVGMSRETARQEDGHLVVYSQIPRSVPLRNLVRTQFHLDTSDQFPPARFQEVRLRLSKNIQQSFEVVSIQPEPTESFTTSGGRYFIFAVLNREDPVRLTLRAQKPGDTRFNAQIYARDFIPFECRNFISVRPDSKPKAQTPVSKGNLHALIQR